MTQSEDILTHLAMTGGALTAKQLTELTGIGKRSLATAVWELRRAGLVDVVGGRRGSYEYGLTPAGRAAVAALASKEAGSATADKAAGAEGDSSGLAELKRALFSAGELKVLQQFIRWLVRERPDLLAADDRDENQRGLAEAVMDYLGLDLAKVKEQLAVLDELVPSRR